ncbi:hypothetical protein RI367_003935 [Sorochytrium milnesiophthora]
MDEKTAASLQEYFRQNVEKKLLVKVPAQSDFDLTPATRLLEKRREMQDTETGLGRQKDEFHVKMEMLSQRREELGRKEKMLHDSLLKFEKFLKENDAKRNRAIKKAYEERKTRDAKDSEITRLRDQCLSLVKVKDRQTKIVDEGLHFQRYLESVLETSDGFSEVKDLLARYDTLSATNAELLERSRIVQEKNEADRVAFVALQEEKNNEILDCNNQIALLKARLEEVKGQVVRWQSVCETEMKTATEKSLEVGQIKMATHNLFNLVKSHLNNRLNATHDTVTQLDKIQQFILDLSAITHDLVVEQRSHPETSPSGGGSNSSSTAAVATLPTLSAAANAAAAAAITTSSSNPAATSTTSTAHAAVDSKKPRAAQR